MSVPLSLSSRKDTVLHYACRIHRKAIAKSKACSESLRRHLHPPLSVEAAFSSSPLSPLPESKCASKWESGVFIELPEFSTPMMSKEILALDLGDLPDALPTDLPAEVTSQSPAHACSESTASIQDGPSRPTFLSLYPELHLMIAKYLDPASHHVLCFTPNTRLCQLYFAPRSLTTSERAMANELLMRDDFERKMRVHIKKHECIEVSELTLLERKRIRETILFCHACDKEVHVRHFSPQELEESFGREGYSKSRGRRCSMSKGTVFFGSMWKSRCLEWEMIEKARTKLLRDANRDGTAPTTSPPANDPRAAGNDNLTGEITRDIWRPSTSSRRYRKHSDEVTKCFPEEFIRLKRRPDVRNPGRFFFQADMQYFTCLFRKWDQSLKKSLRKTRVALALKRPYLCPHMDITDLIFYMDSNALFDGSLLRYTVTSLHGYLLPWTAEQWDLNGNVVKMTKSVTTDCTCIADETNACRTEVTLQRVKCKNKTGLKRFRLRTEKEMWSEYVFLIVRRKFAVTTPSAGQWRAQAVPSTEQLVWADMKGSKRY